jgi:preprotein translocase subunit SecA
MLTRKGIAHQVLNAKQHEREAHIVEKAGEQGAVTVATNMAGRGTDIKLGGGVKDLGGLYVLGTERHEARRIDNQLRGRSGRQGDPGFSRFYLALDDDLMRIFYRDWVSSFMEKLGMTEGQAIESRMVTNAIKNAQKKVEQRNFEIRKNLLEYDEVMDEQRKVIYGARQDALELRNLRERCVKLIEDVVDDKAAAVQGEKGAEPDYEELVQWLKRKFDVDATVEELTKAQHESGVKSRDRMPLAPYLTDRLLKRYEEVEAKEGPVNMRKIEQYLLLSVIDHKWKDHLYAMDALKSGVGLRSYAQMDPKNEYKSEGYRMFQELLRTIADGVTDNLFKLHVPSEEEVKAQREAETRREDAQRVFTSALEAGIHQQSAQQLAQAVFAGQVPADQAIAMVRKAKEEFEKAQSEGRVKTVKTEDGQTITTIEPAPDGAPAALPSSSPSLRPPAAGGARVPLRSAFDVHKQMEREREQAERAVQTSNAGGGSRPTVKHDRSKEVGRNDPCPCGSGKKFKQCHGRSA